MPMSFSTEFKITPKYAEFFMKSFEHRYNVLEGSVRSGKRY